MDDRTAVRNTGSKDEAHFIIILVGLCVTVYNVIVIKIFNY